MRGRSEHRSAQYVEGWRVRRGLVLSAVYFLQHCKDKSTEGLQDSRPDCARVLGYHSASDFGSNQECVVLHGKPSVWISQDALVHAGV